VAFANRSESQVILKIGLPNRETWSEMAALRLFNGEGACRLLEYNEEKYWMLLERLKPGAMLATLGDDEEATRIAAELMKRMWQPAGARHIMPLHKKFIQLTDWFFGGFERLRKQFNSGTVPLDTKLVQRAESSVKDFFAENHRPVLMHGDFHHYNILSSERGWLVIDPKGVIGPAGYEVGPLMMNPWGSISDGGRLKVKIKKRIDILHEHLGFERERIREWTLAHAVLSAWWGIEDNTDWEYSRAFAELIALL
jgi:streptomycin 6-kinase